MASEGSRPSLCPKLNQRLLTSSPTMVCEGPCHPARRFGLPFERLDKNVACGNMVWMMRARFALMICCLCGVAWLAGWTLRANPLKYPKRVITGQTVNLEPLFRWWTNRHGDRPLSAWAHITGAVVATNGWGWTIEGRLDHPPARGHGSAQERASAGGQVKLALQHPPVSELAEFSELTAQSKALNDQSRALSNEVSAAARRLREIGTNNQRSRLLAPQVRQLRLVESQGRAQLANLRPLLADCRAKLAAFPDSTKYILDCLALDMGQEVNGLPLYDYGVPLTGYRSSAPNANTGAAGK